MPRIRYDRLALLALFSTVFLAGLPGPAAADPGLMSCTHGGDDLHVTYTVYSAERASLSGRIGDSEFNCPLSRGRDRICPPGCKIPPRFTVYADLDPAECSVGGDRAHWSPEDLLSSAAVTVVSTGERRMRWREREDLPCTAFRIDPEFARRYHAEHAIEQAPPDDLAAYVGLYPHDAVGDVRFLDHPVFRTALDAMPHDAVLMDAVIDTPSVMEPIRQRDGVLHVSGCEPRQCGSRRWNLQLRADGTAMRGCLIDNRDGVPAVARAYRSGGPPAPLQGDCRRD